jgi:hypothetical protein
MLLRISVPHLVPSSASWLSVTESWGHTSAHAHAEHLLQDVVQIYPATHAPALTRVESGHAMCIVEMSFLFIVENFIRLAYFFEF